MRSAWCLAAQLGLLLRPLEAEPVVNNSRGPQHIGATVQVETLAVEVLKPPPSDSTGVPGLSLHVVAKDYSLASSEGASVFAEFRNDRSTPVRLLTCGSTPRPKVQGWTQGGWATCTHGPCDSSKLAGRRRVSTALPTSRPGPPGEIIAAPGRASEFVALAPCAGWCRLVLTVISDVDTCEVVSNAFTIRGMVRD